MLTFDNRNPGDLDFFEVPYNFEIFYKVNEEFNETTGDSPKWILIDKIWEVEKYLDEPDIFPIW